LAGKESVIQAYKTGNKVGGPAVGAAFAATAAAATASMISSIASTSFGGGGSVSGGSSGYSRPTDAISNEPLPSDAARENTAVTISLQGEVFGRQQVRDLIEKINE